MTIYGPDVSSYQGNVNWPQVRAEGFDFAIVKCTQGDNYLNPYFVSQIDGAKAAGLLVAVYHYIEASCSAASQAAYFASMCDPSWPVILDHENGSGGEDLNWAVYCELKNRGYRVVLNYMPEWYWQKIGSPAIRFGPMWKSWYPDMVQGYASAIYQKCPASAWNGYGGQPVALRQFTSSALIAGQVMDCSAFEGTRDQLAALFGGGQEADLDATQDRLLREVHAQLTGSENPGEYPGWPSKVNPDASLTVVDFIRWIDANLAAPQNSHVEGSTVKLSPLTAAMNADAYGYENEESLKALAAKVDALATGGVDVDALATAVAAKVDAAVATAVANELEKRLAE